MAEIFLDCSSVDDLAQFESSQASLYVISDMIAKFRKVGFDVIWFRVSCRCLFSLDLEFWWYGISWYVFVQRISVWFFPVYRSWGLVIELTLWMLCDVSRIWLALDSNCEGLLSHYFWFLLIFSSSAFDGRLVNIPLEVLVYCIWEDLLSNDSYYCVSVLSRKNQSFIFIYFRGEGVSRE